MIRTLLTLPFLIPMCYYDLKERIVPLYLTSFVVLVSIMWGIHHNLNTSISALGFSVLSLAFMVLFRRKRFIGGADFLILCGFAFLYSVPITIIILILAVGISFAYIQARKDNNVPFIIPLTIAMVFVDLFNGN